MPWFRCQKQGDEAPIEAAAPTCTRPLSVTEPPAQAGEEHQPKRRRGQPRRSRPQQDRRAPTRARQSPEAEARAAKRPSGATGAARRRREPPRQALPQAKRELLVSVDVGEQRVAVLEDGKVAEVYLERPERRSIAGNIYKGRVDNVLPGMEAAFIEIGLEKNGFLYVDEIVTPELEGRRRGREIQDLIKRGEEILVQAVKDPMKGKGARLTTEISLPGRFLVYVPSGEGLGVSRRLEDDERMRLRDILKALARRGRHHRPHRRRGRLAGGHRARPRLPPALWKAIEEQAKKVMRRRSSTRRPSCRCGSSATSSPTTSSARSSTTSGRTSGSSAT